MILEPLHVCRYIAEDFRDRVDFFDQKLAEMKHFVPRLGDFRHPLENVRVNIIDLHHQRILESYRRSVRIERSRVCFLKRIDYLVHFGGVDASGELSHRNGHGNFWVNQDRPEESVETGQVSSRKRRENQLGKRLRQRVSQPSDVSEGALHFHFVDVAGNQIFSLFAEEELAFDDFFLRDERGDSWQFQLLAEIFKSRKIELASVFGVSRDDDFELGEIPVVDVES